MRIEKINENSISCTLTSFDLSVRNLNLLELFYNTEKAHKLFDEMMAKARSEVGFNRDNTPLAIEAIPFSDGLKLVISKVTDPEELDARFSRFTQNPNARKIDRDSWLEKMTSILLEGAENIARSQIRDGGTAVTDGGTEAVKAPSDGNAAAGKNEVRKHIVDPAGYRAFAFTDLDMVINASKSISGFKGESVLYKSPLDGRYVLVLKCHEDDGSDFSKACNVIAEYGRMVRTAQNTLSYYEEHYTVIIGEQAVQKLSTL